MNHFLLRLPSTIGLTLIALVVSLVILSADLVFPIRLDEAIRVRVLEVEFADTLLEGMLGFLLFAGALHVDLERLRNSRWIAALHLSGPTTVVVAGLLIGHAGMQFGISDIMREHVDAFWRVIDEILNAVLFLLIGFEVFALEFSREALVLGLTCIPLAIGARFLAVSGAIWTLRRFHTFTQGVTRILTWGGLRGAISVALVLSLPDSDVKPMLLTATYVVVIFSIVVQSLTMKRVVRRALPEDREIDEAGQVI